MKLDRLLAIVVLLINRGRVQAKDLADTFEVSIRTIYRDIDTLGQAGIPVVTYQGMSGGIGLAEGYRLDRNVLTDRDLASIVTALRSVSTSHTNAARELLMEKLSSIIPESKTMTFRPKPIASLWIIRCGPTRKRCKRNCKSLNRDWISCVQSPLPIAAPKEPKPTEPSILIPLFLKALLVPLCVLP